MPDPRLGEAVAALGLRHRSMAVMRHYLGWSDRQIARLLRLPPGTSKRRVCRAVTALERHLGRECSEDELRSFLESCAEAIDPGEVAVPSSSRPHRARPWVAVAAGAVAVGVAGFAVGGQGTEPVASAAPTTPAPFVEGFMLPPVVLGDEHIWPEEPISGPPHRVATAFAADVLGWETPVFTEPMDVDADPAGPVWIRILPGVVAEFVDVLSVSVAGEGRVLIQIGVPWALETTVGVIERGQPAAAIGLVRVSGAEGANVTIRLADGSHQVAEADGGDIAAGRIELPNLADPEMIESVLIRYLNVNGEVIAAIGGDI